MVFHTILLDAASKIINFTGFEGGVQLGQGWENSIIRNVLNWDSGDFGSNLGFTTL